MTHVSIRAGSSVRSRIGTGEANPEFASLSRTLKERGRLLIQRHLRFHRRLQARLEQALKGVLHLVLVAAPELEAVAVNGGDEGVDLFHVRRARAGLAE